MKTKIWTEAKKKNTQKGIVESKGRTFYSIMLKKKETKWFHREKEEKKNTINLFLFVLSGFLRIAFILNVFINFYIFLVVNGMHGIIKLYTPTHDMFICIACIHRNICDGSIRYTCVKIGSGMTYDNHIHTQRIPTIIFIILHS